MSYLQMAKHGRTVALKNTKADKVLVYPTARAGDISFPADGTPAAYLIDALTDGSSVDEISETAGWSRSAVMVNIYRVAKKSGLGVERRDECLHLLLPEDFEEDHLTPATPPKFKSDAGRLRLAAGRTKLHSAHASGCYL